MAASGAVRGGEADAEAVFVDLKSEAAVAVVVG